MAGVDVEMELTGCVFQWRETSLTVLIERNLFLSERVKRAVSMKSYMVLKYTDSLSEQ